METELDWLLTEFLLTTGLTEISPIGRLSITDQAKPFNIKKFIGVQLVVLASQLQGVPYAGKKKRTKSNSESMKFRENGNRIFVFKKDPKGMEEAIEWYTKSVAYAEPGSQELALAYANRSAVLMKFNRTKECLEDISRVLLLNYPEKLKTKLLMRQAECYSKLANRSYSSAKFWLDKVPKNDTTRSNMVETLKNYSVIKDGDDVEEETVTPKIACVNDKYPCASDAVDIDYSEAHGRHIVATRDIEIGEVLVVEKPYLRFSYVDNIYTHCSTCLRNMWNGIPCENCICAVYCSEECKLEAWTKYHNLECSVLDLLLQYGHKGAEELCTKILFQAINEAGGLKKMIERAKDLQEFLDTNKGLVKEEWYRDETAEGIFALASNEDKRPHQLIRDKALFAIRTVFFLLTETAIFGRRYNLEEVSQGQVVNFMSINDDVKFVVYLLVKLALISKCNFHSSQEDDSGDLKDRGSMGLPFTSLFNHSCFPNTCRVFKRHHVVLYAALPIKKGQQIFDNYGDFSISKPIDMRQAVLSNNYCFTCTCKACEEEWPLMNSLESYEVKAKSAKAKQEIEAALIKFLPLREKVCKRDVRERDKMLEDLYQILTIIYDRVRLPCKTVHSVMGIIQEIYCLTGNVAKVHSVPAHNTNFN